MQEHFLEQMQSISTPDQRILVAVSGGLDSVVLLHLLAKSGYDVAVAHCNFCLRGSEADRDEAFVRQLAFSLQIPFHISRWDTNKYASENRLSTQMAARELRYAWFHELLETEKYDLLATAHHLNDHLETMLINFTRGTGLKGLMGIPQKNGKIIRPLLGITRHEIEAYATAEGLMWCEDSSNQEEDYQRNFIRHQVVPRLKDINPSLEEGFAKTVERLNGAAEMAAVGLEMLRQKYVEQKGSETMVLKTIVTDLQHPAAILWEIFNAYGFNADQCASMVAACARQPGKVFLAPGYMVVVDREALILSPDQERWQEVIIEKGQPLASMGPMEMSLRTSERVMYNTSGTLTAVLDAGRLSFPLVWRRWEAGDQFYPLGMDHRKKISDFLIDDKISSNDKRDVTVLLSAGDIAWVVGYRIDDRFKITGKTTSAVILQVENTNS